MKETIRYTMFEHFLEVLDNFVKFHNQDDDVIMDAILEADLTHLVP
jgi:hypothetical protein